MMFCFLDYIKMLLTFLLKWRGKNTITCSFTVHPSWPPVPLPSKSLQVRRSVLCVPTEKKMYIYILPHKFHVPSPLPPTFTPSTGKLLYFIIGQMTANRRPVSACLKQPVNFWQTLGWESFLHSTEMKCRALQEKNIKCIFLQFTMKRTVDHPYWNFC